jgi:hypothetical protein
MPAARPARPPVRAAAVCRAAIRVWSWCTVPTPSWSEVIERLQRAALTPAAVQNPLTSLAGDVARTRRILALHDGPVILAGQRVTGGRRA